MPAASTRPKCANTGTNEALVGSLLPSGSPKASPFKRNSSAPSATSRLRPSTTASAGSREKVLVTIRNSVMNIPVGGRPAMATTPSARPQPSTGCETVRPRMSAMRCVPLACAM